MNKPRRTYEFIKKLPSRLHGIEQAVESLDSLAHKTHVQTNELGNKTEEQIQAAISEIDIIKQKYADLYTELSARKKIPDNSKLELREKSTSGLQADNHSLDGYYVAFEEKFRGTEAVIRNRLTKSYGKILQKELPKTIKKLPFIDIGCGRGELLDLFKESDIRGIGVDLNKSMVDLCTNKGYEAIQANAVDFLRQKESSSIGGVAGIHIVEHIPFESLIDIFQESYRVIAPGGFALFETPNPENLTVGSFTFWYDSSHLKPIPPDVLAFMLEYCGFGRTKIIRLHPAEELALAKGKSELTKHVAKKIFGPRDYAVIAYK